jgi:hypothetical protein
MHMSVDKYRLMYANGHPGSATMLKVTPPPRDLIAFMKRCRSAPQGIYIFSLFSATPNDGKINLLWLAACNRSADT